VVADHQSRRDQDGVDFRVLTREWRVPQWVAAYPVRATTSELPGRAPKVSRSLPRWQRPQNGIDGAAPLISFSSYKPGPTGTRTQPLPLCSGTFESTDRRRSCCARNRQLAQIRFTGADDPMGCDAVARPVRIRPIPTNYRRSEKCRHFGRLAAKSPVSGEESRSTREEGPDFQGESLLDEFSISEFAGDLWNFGRGGTRRTSLRRPIVAGLDDGFRVRPVRPTDEFVGDFRTSLIAATKSTTPL
jgi:hypothetical protein